MSAKPWRRKRRGRPFGSYHVSHGGGTVNLQTKDAAEALARLRKLRAGKWAPAARGNAAHAEEIAEAEEAAAAAEGVDEALATEPAAPVMDVPPMQPPAAPPAPEPPPPVTPDAVLPPAPAAAGWNADAASAAGEAEGDAPKPEGPPPQMSNEEAAQLALALHLWALKLNARRHFRGFEAPKLDPEAHAKMEEAWTKVLGYAGLDLLLPPWLQELLMELLAPGAVLVMASQGIAAAYKAAAFEQKAAAEAKAQQGAGV